MKNQKRKSKANRKFKHRKREQHKNNKKVAKREGYLRETSDRFKSPKPTSRNKSTQTIK